MVKNHQLLAQARLDCKRCVIYQEHTAEGLTCPLQSKRADKGSGYSSLAEHLIHLMNLARGQVDNGMSLGSQQTKAISE